MGAIQEQKNSKWASVAFLPSCPGADKLGSLVQVKQNLACQATTTPLGQLATSKSLKTLGSHLDSFRGIKPPKL